MAQIELPEGWNAAAADLRHARLSSNLTIDALAASTCISRHHLAAIEAGRFDRCGGKIYAIGFARALARAVAADEARVVQAVKAGWSARRAAAAPQPVRRRRGRIPDLGIATTATMMLSMVPGIRP